jgi:UDP-2,3-diacylglucosamine pyrophosphatase LpxH
MTNQKTMIQAKARALAVELILANAPSSVELYRRGLSIVHGDPVVNALAEELNYVRSRIETFKTPSATPATKARPGSKKRPSA